MTSMPLGMIIEGLVAILLLVTIAYCWILNSRLQRLRADEETLRATISELMTATEIAERAILGLKATAADADQTLGTRLTQAEKMSSLLSDQMVRGEDVFNRISQIADAAKGASAQRDVYSAARAEDPAASGRGAPVYAHERAYEQERSYAPEPVYAPEPARYAPEPARPRSPRADDIRNAAAEATARLERFRHKSGGAAA